MFQEFLSAAKADRLRIVRALLEHGADLEAAKPIPQQQDEPLSRYHTHQAVSTQCYDQHLEAKYKVI